MDNVLNKLKNIFIYALYAEKLYFSIDILKLYKSVSI